MLYQMVYTGYTQKNGAVSIVNTIEPAPFFCVCPVYKEIYMKIYRVGYKLRSEIRIQTSENMSPKKMC